MHGLELLPMAPEDLLSAVEVWERSRWDGRRWLEERMGYSHDDNLAHFRDVVACQNQIWLAWADGTVVGLMALCGTHIDQLYVDPPCQRSGVGTALLEKARRLSPGGLELFTHQRNRGARAFYEGQGFRAVRFGVSPPPENEPDVRYVWDPAPT